MNEYEVWWKVKNSNQILNVRLFATSREDAESKVLSKYGYKFWDVTFTKAEIVQSAHDGKHELEEE